MVAVPFTVIGADSSLFNRPFPGVYSIDMGSGERVELLVKFDEPSKVPRYVTKIYVTCYDFNSKQHVIKARFYLSDQNVYNKYRDPAMTQAIDVPFKDLSTFSKRNVAANRMQLLMNWPR